MLHTCKSSHNSGLVPRSAASGGHVVFGWVKAKHSCWSLLISYILLIFPLFGKLAPYVLHERIIEIQRNLPENATELLKLLIIAYVLAT